MSKTAFGIKAPRFWLWPLALDIYLTLPGGRQIGPVALHRGIKVTGLPPGDYQLTGQFEGFDPFSIPITLTPGEPATFEPMKGASMAQRRAFRRAQGQDGKPTILYLRRRRAHAAQFWLGSCDSAGRLEALLSGTEAAEAEDAAPLSEFSASQGAAWYDHDFLEAAHETAPGGIAQRFHALSWAQEWADELAARAARAGITDPDSLIMLGGDPARPQDWRIPAPADIDRPGASLRYLGIISFSYDDGGPAGR
ncbi:MAG: immunity 22 family protein [Paracoccus sp. (in: a-proteobacteria)]|nr:immunity 22 family protein [Paracoccus sp. (in: a-proteobacteria)]